MTANLLALSSTTEFSMRNQLEIEQDDNRECASTMRRLKRLSYTCWSFQLLWESSKSQITYFNMHHLSLQRVP